MQRQLTLDLGTPPPSTFDNFHTGANAELVARLRGLDAALSASANAADPQADRTFYIWGEPGNGRSHLLHALAYETPPGRVRYLGPKSGLGAFTFDARVPIYAVDDCDSLSGAQQIALFNLFNEVRSHPGTALVATGNAAPMGLAVREDLRTRLGWGLVFHLAPLSDAGKAAVLKHAARERGINLADDVPAYLLTHFRRDMPSLMKLLNQLDRFSLEQKRAVTLPLLRTMLAKGDGEDAAAGDETALEGTDEGFGETGALFGGETGDAAAESAEATESADPADSTAPSQQATGDDNDNSDDSNNRAETAAAAPDAPDESAPRGVELELFPNEPAGEAAQEAGYEAPKPPALQPRAPLGAPPFQPPTDNVEGELGAPFRAVVHRELGTELKGEVEADVSDEMSGELNGDLDPPAAAAEPVDPANPAAPGAPSSAAQPHHAAQPDDPARSGPNTAHAQPGAAAPHDPNAPQAPQDPQDPNNPQAPERPGSPPNAGAGNGFTRFK